MLGLSTLKFKSVLVGALFCGLFLTVLPGCAVDDDANSRPALWVELNGELAHYDNILPGLFLHARGESYEWADDVRRKSNGMRYEGLTYYRGEMVDSPKPWQFLISVYGGSQEGETQLAELVIETAVDTELVLKNMQNWRVWVRQKDQNVRETKDTEDLPPGEYTYVIERRMND